MSDSQSNKTVELRPASPIDRHAVYCTAVYSRVPSLYISRTASESRILRGIIWDERLPTAPKVCRPRSVGIGDNAHSHKVREASKRERVCVKEEAIMSRNRRPNPSRVHRHH